MELIKFNEEDKQYGFLGMKYPSEQIVNLNDGRHLSTCLADIIALSQKDYIQAFELRYQHEGKDVTSVEALEELENLWKAESLEIAVQANLAKFSYHKELAEKLIATEDAYIIYDDRTDDWWGTGPEELGNNLWGIVLMRVRDLLKNSQDNL